MISLSECAPCRARRLQEESEREFRERYGMIDLNKTQMGWRPYMGQVTAAYPSTGAAPAAETSNPYLEQVQNRLLGFTAKGFIGFPIGLLTGVIFKESRASRKQAAQMAMISAGIGLTAALLPWKSTFLDVLAGWSGAFTGFSLSDMALARNKQDAIVAPVI